LCYADCVPVVLVVRGGFAVVHSGWRGTIARVSAKALAVLCAETGAAPGEALAYVGPHILAEDYEVSTDLAERFAGEFGPEARVGERNLDLAFCVDSALLDAGVARDSICHVGVSTPRATDRFYSYRAEGGTCGRHAALAFMGDESHV
ncbi:MAG: polyphenol oxidase family protein, partial [Atopobiaceae bacterium]|nr:polyphenol oxidase family protein [Atopobiaceae bacterium]